MDLRSILFYQRFLNRLLTLNCFFRACRETGQGCQPLLYVERSAGRGEAPRSANALRSSIPPLFGVGGLPQFPRKRGKCLKSFFPSCLFFSSSNFYPFPFPLFTFFFRLMVRIYKLSLICFNFFDGRAWLASRPN